MSADEQASFMQGLAEALNSKEIALPSFPDVVVQIRTALEDPTCTAGRLAEVAKERPDSGGLRRLRGGTSPL